jgi:hypothetical protein
MNAMTEEQGDELIDVFERQRNRQITARQKPGSGSSVSGC